MGLGFPFVYLVFVHGAAGSVVVLAVVFFLSVWVGSGLVGFGLDVVLVVVDASRVRHLHVAFVRPVGPPEFSRGREKVQRIWPKSGVFCYK